MGGGTGPWAAVRGHGRRQHEALGGGAGTWAAARDLGGGSKLVRGGVSMGGGEVLSGGGRTRGWRGEMRSRGGGAWRADARRGPRVGIFRMSSA